MRPWNLLSYNLSPAPYHQHFAHTTALPGIVFQFAQKKVHLVHIRIASRLRFSALLMEKYLWQFKDRPTLKIKSFIHFCWCSMDVFFERPRSSSYDISQLPKNWRKSAENEFCKGRKIWPKFHVFAGLRSSSSGTNINNHTWLNFRLS